MILGLPQVPARAPVLVVDLQQVRANSTAVQRIRAQIETRRDAYEATLREIERDLQAEQRALLERRAEMSNDDYAAAVRALEARLTDAQRSMRQTKADLDRLYSSGMVEVDRAIAAIAEEIAVDRGAQLVLPKAGVLLVRNELEVTDTVLVRLNERLPDIALESPGSSP
jgi:Skp family chaperone for outer membrane proteins